jgi:hypothetical protein
MAFVRKKIDPVHLVGHIYHTAHTGCFLVGPCFEHLPKWMEMEVLEQQLDEMQQAVLVHPLVMGDLRECLLVEQAQVGVQLLGELSGSVEVAERVFLVPRDHHPHHLH